MKSAAVSGSAMLFTPTKRSMHAMKTTPKAGRWWRPEETSTPIVAAITEPSAISPSLGIEARALDRSVDAWKYRRSKTNNIKIEPAMSEASTVPPRSTWAKTVTASTTHATNQARRCPRRIPRAIMIIAMPATAVNAAADWATPRGNIVWTSWRRLRRGGVAVTMTLIRPSRKTRPLAQRRTVRCRRCSFSRSTVTGKGLPVGHEPTVDVAPEGAGCT